eukprot:Skav223460  [mRNA]  locus=scaffold184:282308:282607:+ [translate_table: standard]
MLRPHLVNPLSPRSISGLATHQGIVSAMGWVQLLREHQRANHPPGDNLQLVRAQNPPKPVKAASKLKGKTRYQIAVAAEKRAEKKLEETWNILMWACWE